MVAGPAAARGQDTDIVRLETLIERQAEIKAHTEYLLNELNRYINELNTLRDDVQALHLQVQKASDQLASTLQRFEEAKSLRPTGSGKTPSAM